MLDQEEERRSVAREGAIDVTLLVELRARFLRLAKRHLDLGRRDLRLRQRLDELEVVKNVALCRGELLKQRLLELRELQARLESARKTLARRVELWDADELAPKWAATASWLHPKDKSTAQLLERRRAAYKRAEQLLKQATGLVLTNALPYRAKMVSELQARCADVQAALLPPTILMAEEVAVADQLAALAFLFSSGLGPGPTENARHTPNLVDSSRSTIASPVNLRSPSRNNMGPEQAAETASRGHAHGHGVAHGIVRARTTPQEWLSSQYAERRVDL